MAIIKILKKKSSKSCFKKFVQSFKKGILLITIPYGKYGSYQNMQQFDEKALKTIFKILNPRKIFVKYYKVNKNNWTKTNKFLCKNIEPNIKIDKKNKIVLSANSCGTD